MSLVLAPLVGTRLGVRSWLLFSVWLFEFLRFSLFCCLVSLWLEPCVGQRFVLCVPFEVARASARLVRFALSFCCGHWLLFCGIFVRFCSTSPPGGNQVDGLPPAPSHLARA